VKERRRRSRHLGIPRFFIISYRESSLREEASHSGRRKEERKVDK